MRTLSFWPHSARTTAAHVVSLLAMAFLLGQAPLHAAVRQAKAVGNASESILRIGIGVRPDSLEPSQVTNATAANLLENVVETLVKVDENGKIAPGLASSWEVSRDGLLFTFHLPEGVTFQDGTPLDANAVVWNHARLQDRVRAVAACPVAVELAAIDRVQAIDTTTVTFTLSRPLPNFLATLSWVAWGILSPDSLSLAENKRFNVQHPVGTGPYAFDTMTSDQLVLTRFDGYRGEKPYFSKLAFKFIPSSSDREEGLTKDQLDVILLPSAQQLPNFSHNVKYEVLTKPSSRSIFLSLNNQKAPFNDVRVRQAVNLAVDKQAIIDQVLQGAATVMDAPLASGIFGYCPVGSYDYDPAAAKALLAEAKVEAGTPLTLLTPRGRYLEDEAVANRIAGYLREVGFAVTVEALDWPAFMAELSRPPEQVTVDMHLFGWSPTFADAGWQLPQLYSSKRWPPFGPASSFYKNPEVDALLDAANREVNLGARRDLFCDAEYKIWADAPAVFLWVQSFPVVYRAGLTNISSSANEKVSVAFAKPTAAAAASQPIQRTGGRK